MQQLNHLMMHCFNCIPDSHMPVFMCGYDVYIQATYVR